MVMFLRWQPIGLGLGCFWLAAGALAAPAPHDHAHAAPAGHPVWTRYPLLQAQAARGESAGGVRIDAANLPAPTLVMHGVAQTQGQTLSGWRASREQTGSGHVWFSASGARDDHTVLRASTHVYLPGKPLSPSALLMQRRDGLEIVPQRLPEHGGVRETSQWRFQVRFNGQPRPNVGVELLTEPGTRRVWVSDARGEVEVTFPRDFPEAALTGPNPMNASQGFVLAVNQAIDGRNYLSTYTHRYYPDRMRERSLAAGVGALGFGMVLAAPLIRRKRERA